MRLLSALLRRPPSAAAAAAPLARLVRPLCSAPPPLRLEPAAEAVISRFTAKGEASGAANVIVDEFTKLQARKVKKVLLLCSDYDSYTFEEEGLLSEVVYHEYVQLNLRTPPIIERVNSQEKALARLREDAREINPEFDLVISLLRNANSFVPAALHVVPHMPIAVIALSNTELTSLDPRVMMNQAASVNKRLTWEETEGEAKAPARSAKTAMRDAWIWPFLWQGNTSLFTGIFKAFEDRLNAEKDVQHGVQTILLVEDSVKFYSSYLPAIYSELLKQSAVVANETMGGKEKMMRMYSRPKVLLCTNYEEAMDIFSRYHESVMGVITDAGFPKNGTHDMDAGVALASKVKEKRPDMPIILQSQRRQGGDEERAIAAQCDAMGISFVNKNSASLLQEIRSFLTDKMMFGPLNFQDGGGKPLGSVSTVTELLATWEGLPLPAVAYHARRNDLSKWFRARSEFQLAKRFRNSIYPDHFIDASGGERPDWLRNWILSETQAHRNKLAASVENAKNSDTSMPIVRLGTGALGGKGRGFRFLHSIADEYKLATLMPDLAIVVPRCFILATGVFDRFMEENELYVKALNAPSDSDLQAIFESAPLPPDVTSELHRYLASQTKPLAVRSSSLFEDAFLRPFAGVYDTFMLPNASPSIDTRVKELSWAIRMVYASTYKQAAKLYDESTGQRAEEERMAVILQEVVGTEQEGYFYPSIAGVANSVDFYPPAGAEASHGCASISLGLGNTVVDAAPAVQHINLGLPDQPIGPAEASLPVSALNLSASPTDGDADMLIQLPPEFAALRTHPRAFSPELAPQAGSAPLLRDVHGEQVVFKAGYGEAAPAQARSKSAPAPLPKRLTLKELLNSEVPLAQALSLMLRIGQIGLGCPVELEFALKLRRSPEARHELHVLQVRPQAEIARSTTAAALSQYLPGDQHAAVASTRALGHGAFEGISDVVYVSPDRFDGASTEAMAADISSLNSQLREEGRRFLLMAPGRWGSADSSRGIPVGWNDIDAAGFIVETAVPGGQHVAFSQGSHFFQNIISFGIGYATVDSDEVADYAYWDSLPGKGSGSGLVRHVRLDAPLEVYVDGVSRRGVVMKPGKPFELYVGQVDAFMAMGEVQYNSA